MEILEVQPSVFENGRADYIGMVYTRHIVDGEVTMTGSHPLVDHVTKAGCRKTLQMALPAHLKRVYPGAHLKVLPVPSGK
jgi:hypothetical protein